MALYSVEPDRRTLHGAFSRDVAPILTIDSGDTVRFRTLDADWNLAPRQSTRYDERHAWESSIRGPISCGRWMPQRSKDGINTVRR